MPELAAEGYVNERCFRALAFFILLLFLGVVSNECFKCRDDRLIQDYAEF